ncbi:unnamed protein product [Caenorhabditis sp. 36 PRJEB53466]|nr:unnamed protein product [Caenorhabditis sp. 36 PRJEB53466]
MFVFLLLLLLHRSATAQLTVGGWFFPVSVPPPDPKENTVYDEDVGFPETESVNITHQEIRDYYEKDKLEKWNNQKPSLQPVYKKALDMMHRYHNANDHISTTTLDPLEIAKSKRFLPNSGIQKFIPTPMGFGGMPVNEEPVITMSMSPIGDLNQPEEITVDKTNKSQPIEIEHVDGESEVSSTTEQVTSTRVPFVYEIPKIKSYDDPTMVVEKEKDMMKLKRDVFRLRNEMNLVKALLNKLYKRTYRKQKDFIMKKKDESATRLSAVQADRNVNDWVVLRGMVHRKNQ